MNSHDRTVHFVAATALGLVAIGAAVDAEFAVGVLAGGAFASIDVWAMRRIVGAMLTSGTRPSDVGAWVVVKLVAVLALASALLLAVRVDPVGFALGFGALPLGVVLASVSSILAPGGYGARLRPSAGATISEKE